MKFQITKLFIAISFFVAAFFTPQFISSVFAERAKAPPSEYMHAACAKRCVGCDSKEEFYQLCRIQTYEALKHCENTCVLLNRRDEDSSYFLDAVSLSSFCEKCLTNPQCEKESPDKFKECKVIVWERDMTQVYINRPLYDYKNSSYTLYGCPPGAQLSTDEKRCECPAGKEFDTLQSACIDKQIAKNNIKYLLSILPDDVLKAIYKKAQSQMNIGVKDKEPKLSKEAQDNLFLLASVVSKVTGVNPEDFLANFIYTEILHNAKNLRELLHQIGIEDTKKLVALLEQIVDREKSAAEVSPTSAQELPTGSLTPSITQVTRPEGSCADEYNAAKEKYENFRKAYSAFQGSAQQKELNCQKKLTECRGSKKCTMGNIDYEYCKWGCLTEAGCNSCETDSDCASVGYKATCARDFEPLGALGCKPLEEELIKKQLVELSGCR